MGNQTILPRQPVRPAGCPVCEWLIPTGASVTFEHDMTSDFMGSHCPMSTLGLNMSTVRLALYLCKSVSGLHFPLSLSISCWDYSGHIAFRKYRNHPSASELNDSVAK